MTDAMRSQVASQVGDLIWNPPAGPGDRAAVTVPSDSLAAVLAGAEKCVASHRDRARQSAEVLAALAELRAALPDAAHSKTANETKLRQGGRPKDEQDRPASCRRRSDARRMRDSNSRGVAPNTLSKCAPHGSRPSATVRDLGFRFLVCAPEHPRTQANETTNETGP